jgi:hypothetical protein
MLCTHVCLCMYVFVGVYVSTRTCMLCTCIVCVYVFICMYVYSPFRSSQQVTHLPFPQADHHENLHLPILGLIPSTWWSGHQGSHSWHPAALPSGPAHADKQITCLCLWLTSACVKLGNSQCPAALPFGPVHLDKTFWSHSTLWSVRNRQHSSSDSTICCKFL